MIATKPRTQGRGGSGLSPWVESTARVALLGTGQVAEALAQRVDALTARDLLPALSLVQVLNSRGANTETSTKWTDPVERLADLPRNGQADPLPHLTPEAGLVIDLTASDAVASQHTVWLEEDKIVVTANKRGLGESDRRAKALLEAEQRPGRYRDSATVGAGLGAIRRLREMSLCGEKVFEIAGVLSGTLAWLFDHFDGGRPFSDLVREAYSLGLTEPDPRDDIGGGDVARKLRILARSVGWEVPDDSLVVDALLRCGDGSDPWVDISEMDEAFAALFSKQPSPGAKPAVVARAHPGDYRVSVEWLHPNDPLAQRDGCDNAILIRSERYDERPLILRGPGAGPELTAGAVLEDVLLALGVC